MWIVPRPLHTSHFARDTAALTSDCNELSEQCARSLLVRSSPTPARTWLRKWKRDSWTSHLSGRILRPSHGPSFTEKWTSSLEASLVSHLAQQGNEQVTMTPDTCSPTSSEDSESWDDLPLFSSKMLRAYSAPSSTAPSGQTHKAHPFCSMSSANWSAWVIEQRQEYSARAKQAPPTSENGCSFLVYEMISEQEGAILFQECSRTQSHQVLEPTPTPQDEEPRNTHGSPHESQSGSETAPTRARRWATPSQGDGIRLGCETTDQWRARAEKKKEQGINLHRPLNIKALLDAETQTPRPTGQLNPRWVETLMGLPVGWTMVSCAAPWTIEPMNCGSSATESSPQPQSELSESSGSAWGTPRVGTAKAPQGGGNGDDAPYRLENQVQAWGTPRISCANGPGAPEKGDKGRLENQVREHSAPRTK